MQTEDPDVLKFAVHGRVARLDEVVDHRKTSHEFLTTDFTDR